MFGSLTGKSFGDFNFYVVISFQFCYFTQQCFCFGAVLFTKIPQIFFFCKRLSFLKEYSAKYFCLSVRVDEHLGGGDHI